MQNKIGFNSSFETVTLHLAIAMERYTASSGIQHSDHACHHYKTSTNNLIEIKCSLEQANEIEQRMATERSDYD